MNAPLPHTARALGTSGDDAARWALKLDDGAPLTDAERALLARWQSADETHAQALREALHALRVLDDAAGHDDLLAMRAEALSARPAPRAAWYAPLAGVGVLVLAVAGIGLGGVRLSVPDTTAADSQAFAPALERRPMDAAHYQTAVGERSTVSLPDGSVMMLNTDTELEVAYDADERIVRLLRGQASFQVAKAPGRPFRVLAGHKRITAIGTEFDVRLERARLQVALLHGVVKVDSAWADRANAGATQMVAGDVLDVVDDYQVRVTRGDPQRISGWRDGQVVFDDESLVSAVAEINRYSTRPIQLDAQVGSRYRVSGVFKTGDVDRFAQTLAELFRLKLSHDDAGRPVIGHGP